MRNRQNLGTPFSYSAIFLVDLVVLILVLVPQRVAGQTIRVDAGPTHVVNSFSPLYALGSTVDRVPSNATDTFFQPGQIKQILSAGWGVISYRQNTELFVQAWHWNPKGTWSDPAGKGYFVGDRNPTGDDQTFLRVLSSPSRLYPKQRFGG